MTILHLGQDCRVKCFIEVSSMREREETVSHINRRMQEIKHKTSTRNEPMTKDKVAQVGHHR